MHYFLELTPQEPSSRFERCECVWVVMSDSSKTTSHQQQSVKLSIECSPMPQAISADAKIGPSWSEGEDRERADRFCADGNKTGKLLGGRSCGRKARNFCYCGPEDCLRGGNPM